MDNVPKQSHREVPPSNEWTLRVNDLQMDGQNVYAKKYIRGQLGKIRPTPHLIPFCIVSNSAPWHTIALWQLHEKWARVINRSSPQVHWMYQLQFAPIITEVIERGHRCTSVFILPIHLFACHLVYNWRHAPSAELPGDFFCINMISVHAMESQLLASVRALFSHGEAPAGSRGGRSPDTWDPRGALSACPVARRNRTA